MCFLIFLHHTNPLSLVTVITLFFCTLHWVWNPFLMARYQEKYITILKLTKNFHHYTAVLKGFSTKNTSSNNF